MARLIFSESIPNFHTFVKLTRKKWIAAKYLQLCFELNDRNRNREIKGLMNALSKFNLNKGYIVTCA